MTAAYEIPLLAQAQVFQIQLGTITYQMALQYRDIDQGGWVLDISDQDGNAIVCGIPLVTGADLLGQYGYLGFNGALYVATDGDADAVPTYANLGQTAHLYWVPTS